MTHNGLLNFIRLPNDKRGMRFAIVENSRYFFHQVYIYFIRACIRLDFKHYSSLNSMIFFLLLVAEGGIGSTSKPDALPTYGTFITIIVTSRRHWWLSYSRWTDQKQLITISLRYAVSIRPYLIIPCKTIVRTLFFKFNTNYLRILGTRKEFSPTQMEVFEKASEINSDISLKVVVI